MVANLSSSCLWAKTDGPKVNHRECCYTGKKIDVLWYIDCVSGSFNLEGCRLPGAGDIDSVIPRDPVIAPAFAPRGRNQERGGRKCHLHLKSPREGVAKRKWRCPNHTHTNAMLRSAMKTASSHTSQEDRQTENTVCICRRHKNKKQK